MRLGRLGGPRRAGVSAHRGPAGGGRRPFGRCRALRRQTGAVSAACNHARLRGRRGGRLTGRARSPARWRRLRSKLTRRAMTSRLSGDRAVCWSSDGSRSSIGLPPLAIAIPRSSVCMDSMPASARPPAAPDQHLRALSPTASGPRPPPSSYITPSRCGSRRCRAALPSCNCSERCSGRRCRPRRTCRWPTRPKRRAVRRRGGESIRLAEHAATIT